MSVPRGWWADCIATSIVCPLIVHRLPEPWKVEKKEDNDGEQDNQGGQKHECKEEDTQPEGSILARKESTSH
ncbi:uncharacterized protein BO66DRAFT_392588 [Aspergillus aculeatinus CBS 121060]|uniref:Uncharacterized protein n=1 Tax=Aspergillus aculeatinus CBS 121060 TaxID=1448322 RepID=A0ACD1H664_9EURO|nr:hypothetical protein BO66DRAFT_392588 [Aspergillus aculeatinus CBS 121060]RAH69069.1 hypothetical protein BO66DRAFT_392588 [Aspergillus aculeatinus CBS 121060]